MRDSVEKKSGVHTSIAIMTVLRLHLVFGLPQRVEKVVGLRETNECLRRRVSGG